MDRIKIMMCAAIVAFSACVVPVDTGGGAEEIDTEPAMRVDESVSDLTSAVPSELTLTSATPDSSCLQFCVDIIDCENCGRGYICNQRTSGCVRNNQ